MTSESLFHVESFTSHEQEILSRFFSNSDRPVFAVKNLPDVVKGALFARYSRSHKSLRRLFLDEFYQDRSDAIDHLADAKNAGGDVGRVRAEQLYDRIFSDYGDDSVAQLGAAHIACEQASNLLTKVLERGRLASYLEQSTRYILFDQKLGDSYRYRTPHELTNSSLRVAYEKCMNGLFEAYTTTIQHLTPWLQERFPKSDNDSVAMWNSTLRAKACDIARGLLPAATLSNVGIFASGQAYESMLLRMFAHPSQEVQFYANDILRELRTVVPSFVRRVDQEGRGVQWTKYHVDVSRQTAAIAKRIEAVPPDAQAVDLTEWDPDGEQQVIAGALYEHTHLPDAQLLAIVRGMSADEQNEIFQAIVGQRANRRHRPGRGFERTSYRFDVLCDYGAFRDLQRHRMLTVQWQELTFNHGYTVPTEVVLSGIADRWHAAMSSAARLYRQLDEHHGSHVAQFAVPLAYKVRFNMQMNAREAMHLIELRSQRQGHPSYRSICQQMHTLIRDRAGHRRIAAAMIYVDYAEYDLERLDSERRLATKRQQSLMG